MLVVRRVYLFVVAAFGLAMLATGISYLSRTILAGLFVPGITDQSLRQDLAQSIALSLVGLVAWGSHWWIIRRITAGDATEARSALRRLYLYLALLVAMFALAVSTIELLDALFVGIAGARLEVTRYSDPVPVIVVTAIVWLFHARLAGQDRRALGQEGASATIRRWYVYGVALWGFLTLLSGAGGIVEYLWNEVIGRGEFGGGTFFAPNAASTIVGLAVWFGHWRWSTIGPVADEDRRAILRTVFLLLSLGITVLVTLIQVSQVLYFLLSRLLGVERPGGATGSVLELLANPASVALVWGIAWWYLNRRIRAETARDHSEPRQIGVRRLYRYLVALVSLAILAFGIGGILWTVADLLVAGTTVISSWRERISLYITLAVVGLPVWLVHWRPEPPADETRSLSRRLYVYLALLGGVLAAVISGAVALNELLRIVLGARAGSGSVLVDFVEPAMAMLTGLLVAAYHWRVLRRDQRIVAASALAEGEAQAELLLRQGGRVLRRQQGDRATLEALFDRFAAEGAPGER